MRSWKVEERGAVPNNPILLSVWEELDKKTVPLHKYNVDFVKKSIIQRGLRTGMDSRIRNLIS
jgi:hypothetical protein